MAKLDKLLITICATDQDAANARAFLEQQYGIGESDIQVDSVTTFAYNAKDFNGGNGATASFSNRYVVQARIPVQS